MTRPALWVSLGTGTSQHFCLSHTYPIGVCWVGHGCTAPLLPLPNIPEFPAPHMALPPTAQSCLPFWGFPSPPSCSCPSPRHGRGPGLQPIPTWPQQLPQQLGSGISPLATFHSAPGPQLQECHSRGHKGPLCEQGRAVGAQPSISSWGWGQAQLRARGWAAADSGMAPQLPARHSSLPTTARDIREESPLLILLVPPAPAASCSHCWLGKQHQHQYRASAPVPRDAKVSATPQGEQEGWDLGQGPGAPASSCWIRPFSTAAVSAPAAGNVHGLGLSKAWPQCIKQPIYSTCVPPQ